MLLAKLHVIKLETRSQAQNFMNSTCYFAKNSVYSVDLIKRISRAMAKIRIEMEVWCSDPREFENLMLLLRQGNATDGKNGLYGGYGYAIKVQDLSDDKIRRALAFKKSDLEFDAN